MALLVLGRPVGEAVAPVHHREVVDELDIAFAQTERELVLGGGEVDHVEGFGLRFGHAWDRSGAQGGGGAGDGATGVAEARAVVAKGEE